MSKDTQCRKWFLTINNPTDKDITHNTIKDNINIMKKVTYWCMCDEIGEEGTYHIHIYFALENGIRFSTVKGLFPTAHIEPAKGKHIENREYIRKEGKWAKTKKKETNLPESFEESGEMPLERQGFRADISEQYDMVKQGLSNYEIMEQFEGNVDLTRIDRMRLTYLSEKYKAEERDIKVIYVQGPAGCGKTSGIFAENGYENVYKVDDWRHPFDSYNCEPILLMDDWRPGLTSVTDMLRWLDKYPLKLPCRYANKQACYTTVYITSNEDIKTVYNTKHTTVSKETRQAFLRRIHKVRLYDENYTYKEYDREEYLNLNNGFIDISKYNQEELPFM